MRARTCRRIIREGKVLLQRKLNETVWALPGGKIEPGETPETALRREFNEELGWDVRVGRLLLTFDNHFVLDGAGIQQSEFHFEVFCAATDISSRDKSLEFRWASQTELTEIDFRPLALRQILFQN